MIWYENPVLRATLQSEFKRANQRIATLAKHYGKSSFTYKKYMDPFAKEIYKDLMTVSQGGKKVGNNVTTGGNVKFDVKKINKMILSGQADRDAVNQFLAETVGIKINEDGSITRTSGGVPSITEIRKETEKKLANMGEDPSDFTKKEVDKITEELAEFSSTFDTEYHKFIARYGESVGRNDPVIQRMWGDFRGKKGRLTYRELSDILNKFKEYNQSAARDAISFEENNGGNV